MKKIISLFSAFLVCFLLIQTNVNASSHREAPLIAFDPVADNTDLYAFRSPQDTNKVIIIANYIPFELPQGGPNWYTFGENIYYEIHIDNNTATSGDDIIYRFVFYSKNEDSTTFFNIRLGKQNIKTTYNLTRSIDGGNNWTVITANGVVPPPNIGPRSIEAKGLGLGSSSYDSLMFKAIRTTRTGERVYCGPADDPFFVDLGGAFDAGGFRKDGRDGLAKFNCHSICLEIPISTLQKGGKNTSQATSILDPEFVIGVYASANRRAIRTLDTAGKKPSEIGTLIQVSRLGMPLTNEVVIPVGTKDLWNATKPGNDGQFVPFFKNPELALYMDDSQFGTAVPGLADLRIQTNSLGSFDFRNGKKGLWSLKGSPAVAGTALDDAIFGTILLPDSMSPRAVDLLPIFYTGVPNLAPYQLATGKNGNPLAPGKPFINNFLPTLGDYLRLNMAVPVTPRNHPKFSSLGIIQAAVLGLTDSSYNRNSRLQFIPNMDGFPNGRRLEDDVTTIELQAVSGVALAAIGLWYDDYNGTGSPVTPQLVKVISFDAGVTKNDTTFKTQFPFVQAPWRGFIGPQYSGRASLKAMPSQITFIGEKVENNVELKWHLVNRFNNARYEIERSIGGDKFEKIGNIVVTNPSTADYFFTDAKPSLTIPNHYRLKQVGKAGTITYSEVRTIKFNSNNVITVLPNPATDFIKVYSKKPNVQVTVFDVSGKRMLSQMVTDGMGEFNISRLARGTYTVIADSNGERIDTKKIVKQ